MAEDQSLYTGIATYEPITPIIGVYGFGTLILYISYWTNPLDLPPNTQLREFFMFASALSYIPLSVVNSVNRIRTNSQQLLSDIYYLATKQPTVAVVLCLAALVHVGMAVTINGATTAQDESKLSGMLNLDGISFRPSDEMGSVDIVNNELGNRIFCFGEQAYRVNYGKPNFAQIMKAIDKGTNSACGLAPPVTTTMDEVIKCLELGTQLVFFNAKTNSENRFIDKVNAVVCKKGIGK